MNLSVFMDFLEGLTIFFFGLSWPIAIRKSWVSRTAKGKSLMFEVFLVIGYAIGIIRKSIQMIYLNGSGFIFFFSFIFYLLNFIMISIDICLYFRNIKLDNSRNR